MIFSRLKPLWPAVVLFFCMVLVVEAQQQDADNGADTPQQQQIEEPAGNAPENDAEQADGQDSEEDSPSRFIPTEQISQDLGVSFPADI